MFAPRSAVVQAGNCVTAAVSLCAGPQDREAKQPIPEQPQLTDALERTIMLPVQLHGAMRLPRDSSSRHTRHVAVPASPIEPHWLLGESASSGAAAGAGFSIDRDSSGPRLCATIAATV